MATYLLSKLLFYTLFLSTIFSFSISKNVHPGFLLDDDNNVTTMTESMNINITYNDTYLMIDGFFTALNFSSYVRSYQNCSKSTFDLGLHLISLVKNIENYKEVQDKSTAISIILRDLANVLNGLYSNYLSCRNVPSEMTGLLNLLGKYFSNPFYFRSLYNNLLKNMFFFMNMWAKSKSSFELGRYFEAGKNFGELFSLVLFPEIERIQRSSKVFRTDTSENNVKHGFSCVVEVLLTSLSEIKELKGGFDTKRISDLIFKAEGLFSDCFNRK